jgi:hypothetical protein
MLICLFSFFGSTEKCPQKGDSTNLGHQEMDLLKNRKTSSKKINKGITLEKILKKGDDRKRFKNSDYVEITGYVYDVKWGGAETCNCHSKNKEDLDIHIKIVKEMSSASNRKSMVAEITRYSRGNYTYSEIKEMKGKKVKLKGWMFFDDEHDQNSVNTNPDGSFIWRATSWEIHPCQLIELN